MFRWILKFNKPKVIEKWSQNDWDKLKTFEKEYVELIKQKSSDQTKKESLRSQIILLGRKCRAAEQLKHK